MLNQKVTPGKYIIYFLLISLLSIIITSSFAGFLNYEIDIRLFALWVAALNIFMYIIYLYPLIGILLASSGILFLQIFYLTERKMFNVYVKSVGRFIYNTVIWFIEYFYYGTAEFNNLYVFVTFLVFAAIISIVIFIFVICRRNTIFAAMLGVALISSMWFYGYKYAFEKIQQYVMVYLLLYGFVALDLNQNRWKNNNDFFSKSISPVWLGCTVSVILASYLITCILPLDIKPVNIEPLNKYVFSKVGDFAFNNSIWRQPLNGLNGRFNMSTIGYQEGPSKLGGPVRTSDKLLLKAKVSRETSKIIYIRGTVKDLYTGSMWNKSSKVESIIVDKSQVKDLLGDNSKITSYTEVTLSIKNQGLNTTSIFNIWQPFIVDVNGDSFNVDMSGELYFSKLPGIENEYTVTSKVPNVNGEDLRKAASVAISDDKKKELSIYLQVPDMPSRVLELTKNIIRGKQGDFEKSMAIQKYLRDTYPYTLNTSTVPDDRDFVDYFLFDEKAGYCTYFASAMTIMCRIANIPARYVEGFVLDDSILKDDGYYYVTAQKAHAWTEVYFDGYGWIRFEPTPGYTSLYEDEQTHENVPLPTQDPNYITIPNYQGKITGKTPLIGDEESSGTSQEDLGREPLPLYVYIAMLGILVLLLRVLCKFINYARRVYRADRLDGREAAMEYFDILQKKFKLGGLPMDTAETPAEFGARISKVMEYYGIDTIALMALYGRIRFGNTSMDRRSRNKFKSAIKKADRFVRERKGILKYLALKYVL